MISRPFWGLFSTARIKLFNRTSWPLVTQLMVDAGLLRRASSRGQVVYTVEPERCVSLLVLLALQQLGKVCALQPRVEADHAGWLGYGEGQTITNQMDAVRYMMEHYPHSMPSFEHLTIEQQRVCIFLQTRCELNPGWLIQAEAPPGKVFSQFKSVAQRAAVTKADMSLYFVHWLTDLSPLDRPLVFSGAETFVKRFPQSVLERFIHSWNVVSFLAVQSETQVYERFLQQSWDELKHDALNLPTTVQQGRYPSVALMRLSMHGQTEHEKNAIIDAYNQCPLEVQQVLIDEMGNSAVEGQEYTEKEESSPQPAIMLFYAPQFVRALVASKEVLAALCMLAEIYRMARLAWPAGTDAGAKTVVVRISELLKFTSAAGIVEVYNFNRKFGWHLIVKGEAEAVIDLSPICDVTAGVSVGKHLLAFWRLPPGAVAASSLLGLFQRHKEEIQAEKVAIERRQEIQAEKVLIQRRLERSKSVFRRRTMREAS